MIGSPRSRRRLLLAALALPLALAAPAGAGAQEGVRAQPPYTPPKPFASFSRSALALRDSLVARARAQIGKRYRHGGETPTRGFDCSGLVAYVLSSLHLPVPRTANDQAAAGSEVVRDTSELRPGDLLTFGGGRKVTHIGIYVGDGRFVHASSRAGRVVETPLLRAPAPGIKPWKGVRRLVAADSAPAARDSAG